MTYSGRDGERVEQMFGSVVSADATRGIEVALEGARTGEIFHVPPALDAFFPAAPGEYRLRSTGEVVIDPAFTTTWTVNKPG